MYTTCINCGKKFPQTENEFIVNNRDPICFQCALTELAADYDVDEEPDAIDIENAWNRTTQATREELLEIAEERRRYPEDSDDE